MSCSKRSDSANFLSFLAFSSDSCCCSSAELACSRPSVWMSWCSWKETKVSPGLSWSYSGSSCGTFEEIRLMRSLKEPSESADLRRVSESRRSCSSYTLTWSPSEFAASSPCSSRDCIYWRLKRWVCDVNLMSD